MKVFTFQYLVKIEVKSVAIATDFYCFKYIIIMYKKIFNNFFKNTNNKSINHGILIIFIGKESERYAIQAMARI